MKKKQVLVLLIALAVFISSTIVAYVVGTSGGDVIRKDVSFYTDDGVNLTGTIYIPKTATTETPAAGIVCAPGGNTPSIFYASYEIELARRGYVVFTYNYYGTLGSDYSTAGSSGAVAAMKYLSSLSYVDSTRLGSTGHSNGGAQAFAAITSEPGMAAEKRSVVFIGCGISTNDLTMLENLNVMTIWGKLDECGQGTFWDVVHADKLNYSTFADIAGVTSAEVEPGKIYGSSEDNSVRVTYTPNTFHSLSNIAGSSVKNICNYFDLTLNGNTTGVSNMIYGWQEVAVLVMAISLCVMIFPVGGMLLDTKFFESLKRPVPAATQKGNLMFWLFILVPGILSALIVKTTIIQGQMLMNKLPKLFSTQSTSGFVWWFFLSTLIGIAFYIIHLFVDKSIDKKAELDRLKISFPNLLKAVLFGIVAVGIPYVCAVFAQRLTGWYGRIFQTYLAPIANGQRAWQFIVYFVMFAVLFLRASYNQASLRFKNENGAAEYLVTLIDNALPALLFLGILYGKLVLTHVTPINGREMSRAQGAMMGMLLLYFVIAKSVRYFYKKSGNIYVAAMVNAAFVTWLSVNTPQVII